MRRGSALVWFFVLAFAWSWTLWGLGTWLPMAGPLDTVLAIAGRFGPSVVAIVVVSAVAGRPGAGHLLTPLRRWRVSGRLWAVAMLGPVIVVLAAIALAAAAGTAPGAFNDPASAYLVLPAFATILVIGGPLGEEIGWRGFALDRLQSRFRPLPASLVLGGIWGLWHLPLFLDARTVQHTTPLLLYLGQTISTAVVYTWLWNRTRSLPLALALHTMTNLAAGVFPLLRPDAPDDLAFAMAVALASSLAVGLVVTTRGQLGQVESGPPATRKEPGTRPGTGPGTEPGRTPYPPGTRRARLADDRHRAREARS